jgi:hypothetical protein
MVTDIFIFVLPFKHLLGILVRGTAGGIEADSCSGFENLYEGEDHSDSLDELGWAVCIYLFC